MTSQIRFRLEYLIQTDMVLLFSLKLGEKNLAFLAGFQCDLGPVKIIPRHSLRHGERHLYASV